jgi:hypothetical protein
MAGFRGEEWRFVKNLDYFATVSRLAEERIQQAMEKGDFDDLPGKGRPLPEDDLSMVPGELRMAYRILRNANCLPPEVEDKKQIETTLELLAGLEDENERYRQIRKLNCMITRLNMRRGTRVDLEEKQIYYDRVVQRMSVAKPDSDSS